MSSTITPSVSATPSNANVTDGTNNSDSSNNDALIIAACVVGVIIFIIVHALIVAVIIWYRRSRKREILKSKLILFICYELSTKCVTEVKAILSSSDLLVDEKQANDKLAGEENKTKNTLVVNESPANDKVVVDGNQSDINVVSNNYPCVLIECN